MQTRLSKIQRSTEYSRYPEIIEAAKALSAGKLVAFPTETVYGLGAIAACEQAVAAIFAAKGRPSTKPLTVHLGDIAQIDRWFPDLPELARRLMAKYFPGPLTIVVPNKSKQHLSPLVTAGFDTIGIRVPDHPVAQGLLRLVDQPVVATSANLSGQVCRYAAEQVLADLNGKIDIILDGGTLPGGLPSTVIDVSGAEPRLLREGPLTKIELEQVIGPVLVNGE